MCTWRGIRGGSAAETEHRRLSGSRRAKNAATCRGGAARGSEESSAASAGGASESAKNVATSVGGRGRLAKRGVRGLRGSKAAKRACGGSGRAGVRGRAEKRRLGHIGGRAEQASARGGTLLRHGLCAAEYALVGLLLLLAEAAKGASRLTLRAAAASEQTCATAATELACGGLGALAIRLVVLEAELLE